MLLLRNQISQRFHLWHFFSKTSLLYENAIKKLCLVFKDRTTPNRRRIDVMMDSPYEKTRRTWMFVNLLGAPCSELMCILSYMNNQHPNIINSIENRRYYIQVKDRRANEYMVLTWLGVGRAGSKNRWRCSTARTSKVHLYRHLNSKFKI